MVSRFSRGKRAPSSDPRRTTSRPTPRGSSMLTDRRPGSPASADVVDGRTDTEVSGADVTIDAPHDEQKFTPSGLRWPQWWQNT